MNPSVGIRNSLPKSVLFYWGFIVCLFSHLQSDQNTFYVPPFPPRLSGVP